MKKTTQLFAGLLSLAVVSGGLLVLMALALRLLRAGYKLRH
jgi:hypothetical protein